MNKALRDVFLMIGYFKKNHSLLAVVEDRSNGKLIITE